GPGARRSRSLATPCTTGPHHSCGALTLWLNSYCDADPTEEQQSGGNRQAVGVPLEHAAGFSDDERSGGEVPRREAPLVEAVEPAARHPAQVEGGRTGAPDVADPRQEPRHRGRLRRPRLRPVGEAG